MKLPTRATHTKQSHSAITFPVVRARTKIAFFAALIGAAAVAPSYSYALGVLDTDAAVAPLAVACTGGAAATCLALAWLCQDLTRPRRLNRPEQALQTFLSAVKLRRWSDVVLMVMPTAGSLIAAFPAIPVIFAPPGDVVDLSSRHGVRMYWQNATGVVDGLERRITRIGRPIVVTSDGDIAVVEADLVVSASPELATLAGAYGGVVGALFARRMASHFQTLLVRKALVRTSAGQWRPLSAALSDSDVEKIALDPEPPSTRTSQSLAQLNAT